MIREQEAFDDWNQKVATTQSFIHLFKIITD